MHDFTADYFKIIIMKLTRLDTVELRSRSFSVNQSTLLRVLQKMTVCMIVSISNNSYNEFSFRS